MRKLILSAALVAASVFGMTAVQAAEPVAGKEYIELSNHDIEALASYIQGLH